MIARRPRLAAWSFVGLYFILAAAAYAFQVLNQRLYSGFDYDYATGMAIVLGISAVISAVIATRLPHNPIGWILLAVSVFWSVEFLADGYAYYGLVAHPGSLPWTGPFLLWRSAQASRIGFVLIALMFLWFPDGRPLSPRWGLLVWIAAGAALVYVVLSALEPGIVLNLTGVENPNGVGRSTWAFMEPVAGVAQIVLGVCLIGSAVSLVVRLIRAHGDARQQVKWFLYSAVFFPFSFLMVAYGSRPALVRAGLILQVLSSLGMVMGTAFAILKYRLYDIDLIINRTLVYGLLTGALVLIYSTGVALLQTIFREASGQGSDLAVVASTLVIAALFNPLRGRIQETIDRRFYRRRYDAEKALAAIAATARQAVDPDRLSREILAVVAETMEPERISIWLEEGPAPPEFSRRSAGSGNAPAGRAGGPARA